MDKELAQKAAHWWADFLRGQPPMLNNGDTSPTGDWTVLLASMVQQIEISKGHPADATVFEYELAKDLQTLDVKQLFIGVEYHQDDIPQHAAEKAGVDLGSTRLPWKTRMYIDTEKGTIKVAEGYGSPLKEL